MTPKGPPPQIDLVLAGGGHAHVQVLLSFGMRPEPGVRLTLIAREWEAPYSGMLPGYIAGHYTHDECHINLVRLARFANARLIQGSVTGIDRTEKRILIEGRPPLAYDLLSINVGVTPDVSAIPGAAEHALVVKPISALAPKWLDLDRRTRSKGGPRKFVVVGGGAAGFELVHSLRHRFRDVEGKRPEFTLVAGGTLLKPVNRLARKFARLSLERHRISLIEGDRVSRVLKGGVTLAGGRSLEADSALIATTAGAQRWFRGSGLPVDDGGFLALRPTLQLLDDDDIFAAGDCAAVVEHPREKAGVFAVRQGPILTENLRRHARGEATLPFSPQRQFLMLLSTGGHHAIASRGPLAVQGRWVWRWKDRIDREFMERFNDVTFMHELSAEDEATMRCGGCAAKLGPVTLGQTLTRFNPDHQPEDAAVIGTGKNLRLETVDFFRASWPDPYVFGQIAAVNAMSDIYARGGTPTHAQTIAVLPYMKPKLAGEELFQLLAGARSAFSQAGIEIVGGHSGEGAELAVGFAVSGRVSAAGVAGKHGVKPGDVFILTKPVGTGILFAGEMRGKARGPDIARALKLMSESNAASAKILRAHGVSAMTDVTGFGLAGHLLEMLRASHVNARIDAATIPVHDGVMAMIWDGIASTLLPENLTLAGNVVFDREADKSLLPLLFDPQTSGGLLAAVSAKRATACLQELHRSAAPDAAIIGVAVAARHDGGRIARADVLIHVCRD